MGFLDRFRGKRSEKAVIPEPDAIPPAAGKANSGLVRIKDVDSDNATPQEKMLDLLTKLSSKVQVQQRCHEGSITQLCGYLADSINIIYLCYKNIITGKDESSSLQRVKTWRENSVKTIDRRVNELRRILDLLEDSVFDPNTRAELGQVFRVESEMWEDIKSNFSMIPVNEGALKNDAIRDKAIETIIFRIKASVEERIPQSIYTITRGLDSATLKIDHRKEQLTLATPAKD